MKIILKKTSQGGKNAVVELVYGKGEDQKAIEYSLKNMVYTTRQGLNFVDIRHRLQAELKSEGKIEKDIRELEPIEKNVTLPR